MGTRPSSAEARRSRNVKVNEVKRWYSDLQRRVFPEEWGAVRRRHTPADSTTPEKEARIALYRERAAERLPIQYIRNTVRLAPPASHGSTQSQTSSRTPAPARAAGLAQNRGRS